MNAVVVYNPSTDDLVTVVRQIRQQVERARYALRVQEYQPELEAEVEELRRDVMRLYVDVVGKSIS